MLIAALAALDGCQRTLFAFVVVGWISLIARLKVDGLILNAVVPCSSMDEDARNLALAATLRAEHVVLE
jgi:hypothetical protein